MTEIYNGEFILQWHITHKCNLRCRHCYQDDYSAFSDRSSILDVLDKYERFLEAYRFRGHINITGGEPCLHDDLIFLIEEAKKRSMTCAVLTNGTLVDDGLAFTFKKLGVSYVQVSLDGCEKTHDHIRGKHSFKKAVSGIVSLKKSGMDTIVSFTAQSDNIREFRKLSEYCDMLGVDKLWFDRVVINTSDDREGLSPGAKEYMKLVKLAGKLEKRSCVSCGRALQFLESRNRNIYSCTAGVSLLALLADGSVMPCRRLPVTVGSIRENDFIYIYENSDVIRELRKRNIPEECTLCRYSDTCRGGAKCISYAKLSRYDVRDPGCPVKM